MTDYERACSYEELYKACKECSRDIKWKHSVQKWVCFQPKMVLKLHDDLVSGRYRLQSYKRFVIREPKEREIVATRFRDRVWQRSMCNNGLFDDLTRDFIYDTCACLPGRGTDYAVRRMKCHLQKYRRSYGADGWVLKLDIHKFFPSISHKTALKAIRNRVRSVEFLKYCRDIIRSFGEQGLGLGSQLSQLIANAVLSDLDHYVKEKLHIKHYIRYMDDMVLIHTDKEYLTKVKCMISEILHSIGLQLNPKSGIFPLRQGIVFLKYRFFLTANGNVVMHLCPSSIGRERRKLRRMVQQGIPNERIYEQYNGWRAHAMKADCKRALDKMKNFYLQTLIQNKENQNA